MSEEAVVTGRAEAGKLSVFVSYARSDLEFADQLVAALDACGFTTSIDRKGIHGAENWERRLGQLVLESDTVVFVLTRASAASPVCRWEVDRAVELKKRIVPVLAAPLGDVQAHEHLRDLNYIHFYAEPAVPGSGFGGGLARLAAALSVDVEWMREHTRLGALALRWHADERTDDLLLRGSELARAKRWRDTRPTSAPELTTVQRAYLQASEDTERERLSHERKQLEERQEALAQAERAQDDRTAALKQLSRRTRYGLMGIGVLAALSIVAAAIAYTQNQSLQGAALRLREGMKLRIADTDRMVTATEKWYRIATDYKLAIGVYHEDNESNEPRGLGTGFLVQGGSLRNEWAGRAVFMTASHMLRKPTEDSQPDVSNDYVVFPGLSDTTRLAVEQVLFYSDYNKLDVAVVGLAGPPPRHAVPIDVVTQLEPKSELGGIVVLQWTGQEGFSVGFGHGMEAPGLGIGTEGTRLSYTYVTGPGASGAPVFDADSGKVVCIHVAGMPKAPRPVGYCTSMSKIVDAVKAP